VEAKFLYLHDVPRRNSDAWGAAVRNLYCSEHEGRQTLRLDHNRLFARFGRPVRSSFSMRARLDERTRYKCSSGKKIAKRQMWRFGPSTESVIDKDLVILEQSAAISTNYSINAPTQGWSSGVTQVTST